VRLRVIESHHWKVCAVEELDGSCELEDYLERCSEGEAMGIFAYFERFAANGFDFFNSKQVHEVDKPNKIHEFIKGRHRVLFFNIDGRAIIVGCAHIKKGQKVNSKKVEQAIKVKEKYHKSRQQGQIEFIEDED